MTTNQALPGDWEGQAELIKAALKAKPREVCYGPMPPLKPDTAFQRNAQRAHDYHSLPGFTDRLHG